MDETADVNQVIAFLFAIKFVVMHSDEDSALEVLATIRESSTLSSVREDFVQPIFKVCTYYYAMLTPPDGHTKQVGKIRSVYGDGPPGCCYDQIEGEPLVCPLRDVFVEGRLSIHLGRNCSFIQKLALFEENDLANHALAIMLDSHFIILANQVQSEENHAQLETDNLNVIPFVKKFLRGHQSKEIQDTCLYGE